MTSIRGFGFTHLHRGSAFAEGVKKKFRDA